MDKKTALVQAIELTDEILAVLEEGGFDRVSELEVQRKPLINIAFSDPVEEIDRIRAEHLKNLNQQVVEKLNRFKQSILMQQAKLRTASRATKAYLANDSVPT